MSYVAISYIAKLLSFLLSGREVLSKLNHREHGEKIKYQCPKKGDLPQGAQRKIKINQGNKLFIAFLLCALIK
jgi:hypothetical protein